MERADFDHIRAIVNNLSEEFLNKFDSDTPIEVLWSEFKTNYVFVKVS